MLEERSTSTSTNHVGETPTDVSAPIETVESIVTGRPPPSPTSPRRFSTTSKLPPVPHRRRRPPSRGMRKLIETSEIEDMLDLTSTSISQQRRQPVDASAAAIAESIDEPITSGSPEMMKAGRSVSDQHEQALDNIDLKLTMAQNFVTTRNALESLSEKTLTPLPATTSGTLINSHELEQRVIRFRRPVFTIPTILVPKARTSMSSGSDSRSSIASVSKMKTDNSSVPVRNGGFNIIGVSSTIQSTKSLKTGWLPPMTLRTPPVGVRSTPESDDPGTSSVLSFPFDNLNLNPTCRPSTRNAFIYRQRRRNFDGGNFSSSAGGVTWSEPVNSTSNPEVSPVYAPTALQPLPDSSLQHSTHSLQTVPRNTTLEQHTPNVQAIQPTSFEPPSPISGSTVRLPPPPPLPPSSGFVSSYGPKSWKPPPLPQPMPGRPRDQSLWYEQHPPDMKTHVIFACCVLIACNVMFGAIALILAVYSIGLVSTGDYKQAEQYGRVSLWIAITGIFITLIIAILLLSVSVSSGSRG